MRRTVARLSEQVLPEHATSAPRQPHHLPPPPDIPHPPDRCRNPHKPYPQPSDNPVLVGERIYRTFIPLYVLGQRSSVQATDRQAVLLRAECTSQCTLRQSLPRQRRGLAGASTRHGRKSVMSSELKSNGIPLATIPPPHGVAHRPRLTIVAVTSNVVVIRSPPLSV